MGGGASEVSPLQKKGEGGEVLAMLKGATQGFATVLTQELEVLSILKGVCKKFPSFKMGGGGGG